jgi:hypothetical protein
VKRGLGLSACAAVAVLATAGVAGAAVGGGGSANPNASCQGFLVSNSTVPFAHIVQNDIRTTPGLEGPGIGSIVSGVASGPHAGTIEGCLPAE